MKKSIQEAKAVIPSMEFTQWILYLDMEEERHSKQDYAWARIAAEIRRSYVEHPKKVKEEDLLIVFEKREVSKEVDEEKVMESHKLFWLTSVGLKSDGSS